MCLILTTLRTLQLARADGSFIFQINAPTEGDDYTITVSFDGDDYFASCQATTTVTVTPSTPTPITFSIQVEANNDDCHRRLSTGSFWLTYPALSCGDSSGTAYDAQAGIRFTNVNIPQGATIQSVYLKLKAYSYSGQLVNSRAGRNIQKCKKFIQKVKKPFIVKIKESSGDNGAQRAPLPQEG